MSGPADLERAIRELVARTVDDELRRRGLDAVAVRYTSSSLPPDLRAPSEAQRRRTFAKICRSGRVAGAVKVGTSWECAAHAWRAARIRSQRAPGLRLVEPARLSDDAAIAARAAASVGRRTS